MNGPTLLVSIIVVVSFLALLKIGSWIGGLLKRAGERHEQRYKTLKQIDEDLTEIKNEYARGKNKTKGQKE